MDKEVLKSSLIQLVEARDLRRLRDCCFDLLPADIAEVMHELEPDDQAVVFRILPKELATNTFELLDVDAQQALISALGNSRVAIILNEMEADDRTALLEELPEPVLQELLQLLSSEERGIALTLLNYPENSVGRLMTPDYLRIKEQWTIKDVLEYIRTSAKDIEYINVLFVVDDQGHLIDDVRIKDVLVTPLETPVREILKRKFVALEASADKEAAVEAFRKYDRTILPVVERGNIVVGIVTIDDVLDVVEEETTEDMQKLGGMEALEDPYIKLPLSSLIRKRATWLVVLFLGEMLTASAMGYYENEIQRAVVLALFIPLIISSGGNSGSQASTLIIRALAIGEIELNDYGRVLRREILSGLALGGILGLIGFLRVAVWSTFSTVLGPHWVLIGITLACSLMCVVLWGTVTGAMLPFILKRLRLDPATSSAPFVATLVDVTGLMIYFTLASALLAGVLL